MNDLTITRRRCSPLTARAVDPVTALRQSDAAWAPPYSVAYGVGDATSMRRSGGPGDGASRPPLVLIVIEEEWGARSLDSLLAPNGFAVLRARSGAQALDMARAVPPDAVILDWRLPDLDGVTVCQRLIGSADFNPATPILLTDTHAAGRVGRLAALAAGAWLFCPQPFDGEALLHQLRTFVRAKRESDRLHEESLMDQATGMYSFRGLTKRARELGAEALRLRRALACVAFAPAQPVGPVTAPIQASLVNYFGTLCRRWGRVSDAVGRLGPLEFAVIAPSTDAAGAERLANRLRELAERSPLIAEGVSGILDIRAGYCAVPDFAEASLDATEMLTRAMNALRRARADGAGMVVHDFDHLPVCPA